MLSQHTRPPTVQAKNGLVVEYWSGTSTCNQMGSSPSRLFRFPLKRSSVHIRLSVDVQDTGKTFKTTATDDLLHIKIYILWRYYKSADLQSSRTRLQIMQIMLQCSEELLRLLHAMKKTVITVEFLKEEASSTSSPAHQCAPQVSTPSGEVWTDDGW